MDAPNYVQGLYTVAQRDAIFTKANKYPDAANGLQNQVPTIFPDGSIGWRQIPEGGDGTANANIAVVEPTQYASKDYSVGDLLIYNGQLSRVSAPIAAGETITPETNVVSTTVALWALESFVPLVGKGDNLLDNAYFIGGGTAGAFPVNQRYPQTVFNLGEKIDRWAVVGFAGTLTLNSGYATLVSTGAFTVVRQKISRPLKLGDVVTISILTDSNCFFATGAFPSESNPLAAVIDGATGTRIQVFMGGDGYPYCDIISVSGVTINIKAVKLELGSQQTLARQVNGSWVLNDTPPDYSEELAKCQRYLVVYRDMGLVAHGWMRDASTAAVTVVTPVPMKPIQANTPVQLSNIPCIQSAVAAWYNAASGTVQNVTGNLVTIHLSFTDTMVPGSLISCGLNPGGYLIISAE